MLDALLIAYNVSDTLHWCVPDRDRLLYSLREQVGEVEQIAKAPDVMEVYLAPGWVAVVERRGREWCVYARRVE